MRTNFEARRPQKAQLSSTANELLASRPNDVKLRERMERIDADWAHVESSLAACEQQLSAVQTLLLPSMQASRELIVWMDGVEQTVKAESSLQPKNADDVEQLLKKFTVSHKYLSCCHSLLRLFNDVFSSTYCNRLNRVPDTPASTELQYIRAVKTAHMCRPYVQVVRIGRKVVQKNDIRYRY